MSLNIGVGRLIPSGGWHIKVGHCKVDANLTDEEFLRLYSAMSQALAGDQDYKEYMERIEEENSGE